jgi:uncharacterized protein
MNQLAQLATQRADKCDASHDVYHIKRVVDLSMQIAKQEGITDLETLNIIKAAAWAHDMDDHKYEKNGSCFVNTILTDLGFKETQVNRIMYVINNMSFSKQVERGDEKINMPIELCIVQDADRLDAIGAIGTARCFGFSGSRHGMYFYDPMDEYDAENLDADEYKKSKSGSIRHFDEKLFKLKDLMTTGTGRVMAEKRHVFMKKFYNQFMLEMQMKS